VSSKWFSFFTIIKEDWLISQQGVNMSKIGQYFMEHGATYEPLRKPTTKHVTVTTAYTYTYEVARDFNIYDDDALTSLMANGTPVNEGVSGSTQSVSDCSTSQERTFTFEG